MEVIFIVFLMCHFKQPVNLFPSWWFNQCRETAIHHHNGSLVAVNVSFRKSERQHTTTTIHKKTIALRVNTNVCVEKV